MTIGTNVGGAGIFLDRGERACFFGGGGGAGGSVDKGGADEGENAGDTGEEGHTAESWGSVTMGSLLSSSSTLRFFGGSGLAVSGSPSSTSARSTLGHSGSNAKIGLSMSVMCNALCVWIQIKNNKKKIIQKHFKTIKKKFLGLFIYILFGVTSGMLSTCCRKHLGYAR